MKLRTRIVLIFILSIIISVIVFLFVSASLIQGVGGYTEYDVDRYLADAAKAVAEENALTPERASVVLARWPSFEFDLLAPDTTVIYSTHGEQGLIGWGELMDRLNRVPLWQRSEITMGRPIVSDDHTIGYLLCSVKPEMSAPLVIRGDRRAGSMILRIFLAGLGITVVVSTLLAVLLTWRMTRRLSRVYRGIASFGLGNLGVSITDTSKDEVGQLASTFNVMAQKIRDQVTQEHALQQERQELVSNISHDLRTPLTSIIGYSESLTSGVYDQDEDRLKVTEIIHRKALYMDKLLGELLEYSRLESGTFTLRAVPTNISELLREVMIEYLPSLQEKRIELNVEIPEPPVIVEIDGDRISRVIRNLIDNVLSHGWQGKYLGVYLRSDEQAVSVNIVDHGSGISQEHLAHIFDRFYRGDAGRGSEGGGMGLGLAIAHEIVKRHGGELSVTSAIGSGTAFLITIPLKKIDH